MDKKSLVSIIIPTYKRSSKIKNAVLNCISQTYRNIEIIVVDDNGLGTEGQIKTEAVLIEFINSKQITYIINSENKGATYSRNKGAKIAEGSIITFFDDDDLWDEFKIEKQITCLNGLSEDYAMVGCHQKIINSENDKAEGIDYNYPNDNQFNYLLNNPFAGFSTPNPILRKICFEEIGGFNEGLPSSQDLDLFLRLLKKYKIKFVHEYLHFHIIHDGIRISSNHKSKIEGFEYLLNSYGESMNKEVIGFYLRRILVHTFFINDINKAKECFDKIIKVRALDVKHLIIYLSLRYSILYNFIYHRLSR